MFSLDFSVAKETLKWKTRFKDQFYESFIYYIDKICAPEKYYHVLIVNKYII